MTRARRSIVFGFGLLLASVALAGCGHCEGAIRRMRAQRADCHEDECRARAGERVTIAADETFRIGGDGPNEGSEALLGASGIDGEAWFLIAEASGERVPATIDGDAGGHSCRYGVGFNLRPEAPLPAGDYTLVLRLDAVAWPLVGRDPYGERGSVDGAPALIRRFRVE